MSDEPKTVSVRITGRVQGVWFRAWTSREATELGLKGWVRNEADGSVSALLSGAPEAVDAMIRLLWQGPPKADVTDVKVEDAGPTEALSGFQVLR
ncbi:acylphosphatase [Oricola sp.]|uniref:acylphosphatase n=1 Tax=Oricola sp. TaxID=1979950 RepID=UPI0025F1D478|nr:acylphosphatase [Oricola sp.]MCI5077288.1 acylphosphatase [Oricola sp.]